MEGQYLSSRMKLMTKCILTELIIVIRIIEGVAVKSIVRTELAMFALAVAIAATLLGQT